MKYFLASLILLSGCTTQPAEIKEVKIPVPVIVSCPSVSKPDMAKPRDDSRVEWLRAELVNRELNKAYIKELESTLEACK